MKLGALALAGLLCLEVIHSEAIAEAGRRLTITAVANLAIARAGHTATLLSDGSVLVVGGSKDGKSAERYLPKENRWMSVSSMRVARSLGHTATLLPNGQVFVAGGVSDHCAAEFENEIFDPESGTWRNAGSLTERRFGHSATLLPDGKVLIVGGRTWACDGDWPPDYASIVEICDPMKGYCRGMDSVEVSRAFHKAVLVAPVESCSLVAKPI